jgi:hypothetical protein
VEANWILTKTYSSDFFFAAYQRAAVFVDKILMGTKAGDIPMEQATKFQFRHQFEERQTLGVVRLEPNSRCCNQVEMSLALQS